MVNGLLSGRSRREIAAENGISPKTLNAILRDPAIRDVITQRLEKLAEKVITFKLDAVDGAVSALAELRKLSTTGLSEDTRRQAAAEVIRISGLMPRKRVLVEGDYDNGIGEDLRDYIREVVEEMNNTVEEAP